MPQYDYRIQLRGSKVGNAGGTSLHFDLGDLVDEAAALNAANQIRGALVDITDAFVARETLSLTISEDNQVPPSADVTDFAHVACHLNAPTEAQKLHVLKIPAPIDGLFQPGGVVVDITNALLQQYVQQVSQHAFVSDGEQIDTASGTAGINSGWWFSKKKSSK